MLTPVARQLAIKFKAIDKPCSRKVHSEPTPRWGGIAIALSVLLAVFMSLVFFEDVRLHMHSRTQLNLMGLTLGGGLMLVLGMLDDRYDVPAKLKLAGQIVIAIIMIKFGIVISFLNIPFMGFTYLPAWISWPLTIFWIVGITNAINLLDGLDGLLAGVSVIISILFFIIALMTGQFTVALLMMALTGASLGFLRYNFNPASIFMGDSGSLFLGLMYASLSIIGALKVSTTVAILIPVFIMGLPIFDTSFAIIRRFTNGRPIFSADKEHVHHQLLARGYSVKQAVIYMYVICGTLGAIGVSLALFIH